MDSTEVTDIHGEYQYLNLLRELIESGDRRMDRTGTGTLASFGRQLRFDLSKGFPLLTTKRIYWKTAFKEMLWMLSGGHNIRELLQQNVRIWTEWPLQRYRQAIDPDMTQADFEQRILEDEAFAQQWGDLGPVYGKQWRAWKTEDGQTIDQVSRVVEDLKNNPSSRRIIWEGWNVAELDQMALPPCHKHYQFYVDQETQRLHGALIQRSADVFLGLAFNIANLSLVIHLLSEQTGYQPGEAVWFGLDVHLYLNHLEQAKQQLQREPKALPSLLIRTKPDTLFDYKIEDFELLGYDPHPPIQAPVAV